MDLARRAAEVLNIALCSVTILIPMQPMEFHCLSCGQVPLQLQLVRNQCGHADLLTINSILLDLHKCVKSRSRPFHASTEPIVESAGRQFQKQNCAVHRNPKTTTYSSKEARFSYSKLARLKLCAPYMTAWLFNDFPRGSDSAIPCVAVIGVFVFSSRLNSGLGC